MRYMKYGELRINLENLLGVYMEREEVGDKYVDDNSEIVIQSFNFDNSISTTKILCKFELGKKIINKLANLLSSEYINIQSVMIIKKDFIKVWYSNSKQDCLVEDFNGELIYIGDNRDDLLNIDKELDKDEQNVFTVK